MSNGQPLTAAEYFELVDLSTPYIPELHDDDQDDQDEEMTA
ncbi:hypothetical protein [Streptomyces albus]|nr:MULTISPECIES: hypothetical protein [Streptomyces]